MRTDAKTKLSTAGVEPAFGPLVRRFLSQQFPQIRMAPAETLEAVFSEIIGTKQLRYGPRPSPESMVAIRNAIRMHIADGAPIPVLIPWGSRKPDYQRGVDLAELMALWQLDNLNEMVKMYYPPGLDINIRVEDYTGFILFADEGEQMLEGSVRYCDDFTRLVRVLGYDGFIHPHLESELLQERSKIEDTDVARELADYVEFYAPLFARYLQESEGMDEEEAMRLPLFQSLVDAGWQNPISFEMREHYRKMYRKAYPTMTEKAMDVKLGLYFALSLARVVFQITGARDNNLKFFFGSPVPGDGRSVANLTMNYRTVPERWSRNNMNPWRATGYLRIVENPDDFEAAPALAGRHETDILQALNPGHIMLTREGDTVQVAVDYLLE